MRMLVLLVCTLPLGAWAEVVDPDVILDEAIRAARGGDQGRALAPDDPAVLWNIGLLYAERGNHQEALLIWKRYRQIDPGDWQARAKLIQTYQALGQLGRRDRERDDLLEWYAQATGYSRPKEDRFCRDQFEVDGIRVMVFEAFAPSGNRRVFYWFYVLDADGGEAFRYSLGSYDATTAFARNTGQIGEADRLYHLDRYEETPHRASHVLLGFFKKMPTYDETKQKVIAALEGHSKPESGATIFRPSPAPN